jgi:glutathione synthase/RimK-type ligase-like ATP-grasp enzyme
MSGVDVVIVADDRDAHATAVDAELNAIGVSTVRFNLSHLRAVAQSAHPGALDLLIGSEWRRISHKTTVWWHRAGTVDTADLTGEEVQLAYDEGPHLLRGSLAAAGVRWVDEPFDVDRAETKLFQLAVAAGLSLTIPATLTTNDPGAAGDFAVERRVVAKPVSPGVGIVPHVAEVGDADLAQVSGNPTLLQALVTATADLRVVVVNGHAWVWRRPRGPTTIDWRSDDPDGSGFTPTVNEELCRSAIRLTSALGLTMSIQDWLDTSGGPTFLEANPQGAWLFLDQSAQIVAPAIARHLRDATRDVPGVWPRALKRFLWDFRSRGKAPPNDGIVAPEFRAPSWLDEVAQLPDALETARRAREASEAAAKAAEEKADRLVKLALSLLAIALALGAFQLTFSLEHTWRWLPGLAPIGASLFCLALAAFEAIEIDRVGMYGHPMASHLATFGQKDPRSVLLEREEDGRRLAGWTSVNKHSDLMQARAWLSRGLAALIVAALVAGSARASTARQSTKPALTTTTTTILRLTTTTSSPAPTAVSRQP